MGFIRKIIYLGDGSYSERVKENDFVERLI